MLIINEHGYAYNNRYGMKKDIGKEKILNQNRHLHFLLTVKNIYTMNRHNSYLLISTTTRTRKKMKKRRNQKRNLKQQSTE